MGLVVLLLTATGLILLLGAGTLVHALRHPPRQTFAVALGQGHPTDPTDLGRTGQAITFTLSDQTTTPGWILTGDDPAGPVVILLHGYGDGRYGSLGRAQHVLPFASHVVVYDQRGQGESQAPTSTGSLTETPDLLHLIDQLPLDTRALVLMGYSMGAGTALAAAHQSSRVVGVVVDGAYRKWDDPLRQFFARRRYPAWPIIALARLWLRWICHTPIHFDRVDDAGHLTCPLLVLHSTDDPLCPFPCAQAIAEAAPQGQLVRFDQGGHLGLADADPVRYREALAHFFHALPKAQP